MTDNTEREDFERIYAEGKSAAALTYIFDRRSNGDYVHKIVEQCWRLWLRRAALSQPAAGGAVPQVDISGSYVADDDTYPEMVMFSDGRIVAISHDNEEPYLVVSRKRDKDFSHILTAIGKERAEAWASIEASYKEAATLRATAAPDESRELIEFVTRRFGLSLDITGKMLSVDDLHKAFNESRKR